MRARFLLASALLLSFAAPVRAQEPATATTLFSPDVNDIPGKEGMMLIVEYPPGGVGPVHRHNAKEIDPALVEAVDHTDTGQWVVYSLRAEQSHPGVARHGFHAHNLYRTASAQTSLPPHLFPI